jgi:hypothetical protein
MDVIIDAFETTQMTELRGSEGQFDSLTINAGANLRIWSDAQSTYVATQGDQRSVLITQFESLSINAPGLVMEPGTQLNAVALTVTTHAPGIEVVGGLDADLSARVPTFLTLLGSVDTKTYSSPMESALSAEAVGMSYDWTGLPDTAIENWGMLDVRQGATINFAMEPASLRFLNRWAASSTERATVESILSTGTLEAAGGKVYVSNPLGVQLSLSDVAWSSYSPNNPLLGIGSLVLSEGAAISVGSSAWYGTPAYTLTTTLRSAYLVAEHTQKVTDLTPSLASDLPAGGKLKFSLTGEDAALFQVSNKGVLSFRHAPDEQLHQDANGDGNYVLTVVATDTKSGQIAQRDVSVFVQMVELQGTAADDDLKSGSACDVIDGMAGDDKLTGGMGRDVFMISSGHDTVVDFNHLGQGGTGAEVLTVAEGASVTATVKSAWTATSESINHGEALLLTKGLALDLSAITQGHGWTLQAQGKEGVHLTGSAGADKLLGSSGDDVLIGGEGDDWLAGGQRR